MALHITYRYRQVNSCTGQQIGAEITTTDPECDPSCFAALGPHRVPVGGAGLYYAYRVFHPDTCTFDEPVCVLAPPCPTVGCPPGPAPAPIPPSPLGARSVFDPGILFNPGVWAGA